MEATKRINTVAFCEKDEYCRKVLKKHWSNTQQYIDIRDIDGTKISADIISGGFPCQPFSVAGKRKGTTDDRYLWDEMLRVITEVKPIWIVGENVQGIINIDNGLVLRQVQTDLEAQGFQVQCFLIPASGIGAWHKRNRVWIIANSNPRFSIGENEEIQARGTPLTVAVKMFPTPRSSGQENPETLIKRKGWKKAIQHNLTATVQMFPTPTVGCEEGGEQSKRVEQTKSGGFILRKKNKPDSTFGAKLSDAMLYLEKKKMLPTPTN